MAPLLCLPVVPPPYANPAIDGCVSTAKASCSSSAMGSSVGHFSARRSGTARSVRQDALADYLRLVVQLPSVVYSSASPFSSVLQEAGATHNGVEGAHPPARCSTSTMEPPVFYMRDVWNSDRAVDDRRDTLLWNRLALAPLSPSPRPRQTNRQATPGQVLLKAPGLESRGSPCPALSNRSTSIPCSWCVVSCRASNTKMARPSGAERS